MMEFDINLKFAYDAVLHRNIELETQIISEIEGKKIILSLLKDARNNLYSMTDPNLISRIDEVIKGESGK